jgi:hypothetical protein
VVCGAQGLSKLSRVSSLLGSVEEQRARRKRNHKSTKQMLYAVATGMVLYMYFKHLTRGVIDGARRRVPSSPHNPNPCTRCTLSPRRLPQTAARTHSTLVCYGSCHLVGDAF